MSTLIVDQIIGNGIVPINGIIMWNGSYAEAIQLEPRWALCDGRTVNDRTTPDLRNKFIVGASSGTGDTTYPGVSIGSTGGSADATLVAHYHQLRDGTGGDNTNSITNGGGNLAGQNSPTVLRDLPNIMSSGQRSDNNAPATSATNGNLPPYYALAFIMRTT